MKFKNIGIILSFLFNDINNEKINEVYTYSTEYSTEEILLGTEYLIEEDSDNEETISLNRDLEDVNVCLTPECIAVSENLLKIIKALEGEYESHGNLSEEDDEYNKKLFYKIKSFIHHEYKTEAIETILSRFNILGNKDNFKNVDFLTENNKCKYFDENKSRKRKDDIIEIFSQGYDIDNDNEDSIGSIVDSIFEFEKKMTLLTDSYLTSCTDNTNNENPESYEKENTKEETINSLSVK
ncbi:hypothetical protein U3516DRAFT_796603 [Neocallimastix sp. 'constans']